MTSIWLYILCSYSTNSLLEDLKTRSLKRLTSFSKFQMYTMIGLIFFLALSGSNIIRASAATGEIDISNIRGAEITYAYDEMNSQLVRAVPECDIDKTLKAAKEYLDTKDRGITSSGIYKFVTSQVQVSPAYKLFAALSQINDANRCDATSINIIKQNDWAILRKTPYDLTDSGKSEEKCRKRVELVLAHYLGKSVKECPRVHADLLKQMLKNYDQRQLDYVVHLTEDTISKYLSETTRDGSSREDTLVQLALLTAYTMRSDLLSGEKFRNNLEKVLNKFAPPEAKDCLGEGTRFNIMNKGKIKKLFKEYGIKPCKNYVKFFGPEVFESEIYLSNYKPEPLAIGNPNREEFYLNWIRYNICSEYIAYEKKLLDEVIQSTN